MYLMSCYDFLDNHGNHLAVPCRYLTERKEPAPWAITSKVLKMLLATTGFGCFTVGIVNQVGATDLKWQRDLKTRLYATAGRPLISVSGPVCPIPQPVGVWFNPSKHRLHTMGGLA